MKCLTTLLGPWKRDGRDRLVGDGKGRTDFDQASTDDIAANLHVALKRGDIRAMETIRDVWGSPFSNPPNSKPERRWPYASGDVDGLTLVHSAADNATADPLCIWLALEAEGEAPSRSGGFDRCIDPVLAARAASDAATGESANVTLASVSSQPLQRQPSLVDREFTKYTAVRDRTAASITDDIGVTPLMLAAGGGPGWEGCVAALLRSAAAFEGDCISFGTALGVTMFDPNDPKFAKRVADSLIFKGASAAAIIRDEETTCNAAHYAAGTGAIASLRMLRAAHPGCVRSVDCNRRKALHHAAANGHAQCVRVLVDELGVSRVATDYRGWIPLMYSDFVSELGVGLGARSAALVLMERDLQPQLEALRNLAEDALSIPSLKRVVRSLAEVPECYEALNVFLRDNPPPAGSRRAAKVPSITFLQQAGWKIGQYEGKERAHHGG